MDGWMKGCSRLDLHGSSTHSLTHSHVQNRGHQSRKRGLRWWKSRKSDTLDFALLSLSNPFLFCFGSLQLNVTLTIKYHWQCTFRWLIQERLTGAFHTQTHSLTCTKPRTSIKEAEIKMMKKSWKRRARLCFALSYYFIPIPLLSCHWS